MAIHYKITTTTTTPYAVKTTDQVVNVNVVGPASIVLPAAGASSGGADVEVLVVGCTYIIKDISGNARVNPITITAAGGLLIDAANFALLVGNYAYVTVMYNGVKWQTVE